MTYVCGGCGAEGVKLWREYQTFSPRVLCVVCCCALRGIDPDTVDDEGFRQRDDRGRTDQLGWWVPAVPVPDEDAYWGYTSVPEDGIKWWRALPTRAEDGPEPASAPPREP